MTKRFRFIPFWKLTDRGWLPEYFFRLGKGCDEYHNKSRFIILPFVGEIVVFYQRHLKFGPEHLWARLNGVWYGLDDPDCDLCQEFKTSD